MTKVYEASSHKIPIRTLYFWKKNPDGRRKSGRKSKWPVLEEELFEWFLIARARKMSVSDQDLRTKAVKIAQKYVERANQARDQG